MHYVTVKNSDVKEHIEAEKNVHSKIHKEEIDKGNKLAWDMWMISNSTYGDPTTTFLYVHFTNPDANYDTQNSSNFTAHEREAHRKAYQSRVVKEGGLTLGIKASYGITPGDMPPKNLVINYMNVDFLKNYEVPPHLDQDASKKELVNMVEDINSEIQLLKENSFKLLKSKQTYKLKNYFFLENIVFR